MLFFFSQFFVLSALHHAKLPASSCCTLTPRFGVCPHRLYLIAEDTGSAQLCHFLRIPSLCRPGCGIQLAWPPAWALLPPKFSFPSSPWGASSSEWLRLGGANTAALPHTSSHTTIKPWLQARHSYWEKQSSFLDASSIHIFFLAFLQLLELFLLAQDTTTRKLECMSVRGARLSLTQKS